MSTSTNTARRMVSGSMDTITSTLQTTSISSAASSVVGSVGVGGSGGNHNLNNNSQSKSLVRCSYLPHTAITNTHHVSVSVLSLHCILGTSDQPYYNNNHNVTEDDTMMMMSDDEKKSTSTSGGNSSTYHNHHVGCWPPLMHYPSSSRSSNSHKDRSILTDNNNNYYEEEGMNNGQVIHVEATLFAFGVPLHATPISTCKGILLHNNNNNNNNNYNDYSKITHPVLTCTHVCTFPSTNCVLHFPLKWNELPRDTSIVFRIINAEERVLYKTTMPIFHNIHNSNNSGGILMRMGLQRLPLHHPNNNKTNVDDFHHVETSSLSTGSLYHFGQTANTSFSSNENSNSSMKEDPKWKASLVLDILNRLEHQKQKKLKRNTISDTNNNNNDNNKSVDSSSQQYEPPIPSVPWLDNFTRKRCHDILTDNPYNNNNNDPQHHSSSNETASLSTNNHSTQSSLPSFYAAMFHSNANNSSYSDYHRYISECPLSYLIVELPMCVIPVLHEETFYPYNQKQGGASGSVTALDISYYHQKRLDGTTSSNNYESSNNDDLIGLSLVQILDQEKEDNNPAEEKYRTLAHDLLRGIVDPALKPDRVQLARLSKIIASPSQHLTMDEKDLLWRFRFSLVDNRKALTKFLLAVEWTVESEVVQAAELLEQWRKRSPIEVTDALKLLGKNVAFQTSLVRDYAIDTLAAAPDDELRLYLLQLVQALKYENVNNNTFVNSTTGQNSNNSENRNDKSSSLASFLIDRASRNIELSSYLYWYLKVELEDPQNGPRYRGVYTTFKERLSKTIFTNSENRSNVTGSSISSTNTSSFVGKSMWEILLEQDTLISGIMNCQMKSRDAKGKKDAKEANLRELLSSIPNVSDGKSVPLPSAPHIWVKGVRSDTAKMFKSALYPSVIEFILDKQDGSSNTQEHHSEGAKNDVKSTYKVIVKTGDDLRQDQLVIMMIQLMDGLLKRGTLDLCLKPYSIIAMSQSTGLVEFVGGSIPISQILTSYNNSIKQFFQRVAHKEGSKYEIQPEVLQTYIKSCAGYCVITYLLGVGDRHLDNIMLLPTGHFFHIDFGFIFGRDPKPLPPAFRLTREMVDGMGGTDSAEYRQFCSLACQAYNLLRKSAGLVLNLLRLMSDAGIEDLSNNPSADVDGVIAKVEERFRLELTDEQAESYFNGLISDCLTALAPRVMDVFHQIAVARR